MTRILAVDPRALGPDDLAPAVRHLAAGGLLAYPTETIYGLGGAAEPEPVARVLALKGRAPDRPLLVLVESRETVRGLGWTEAAERLADAFWPGPLTLVLSDPRSLFPRGVRSPWTGAVGVRVSPHPVVLGLVASFGRPITSTSLNEAGGVPAHTGAEAAEVARALGGGDILVVDAGPLPPSAPSTMVDCTGAVPTVLREGSVPAEDVRRVVGEMDERKSQ